MMEVVESIEKVEFRVGNLGIMFWVLVDSHDLYKEIKKLHQKTKKKQRKRKKKLGKLKNVRFDFPKYLPPILHQSIEYNNRANMYCFNSPKFQATKRKL